MPNPVNQNGSPKQLADAVMLEVLSRAREGKLHRGEAERVRAIMGAFKDWSDASQRCELVERAREIARLGAEIKAQSNTLPDDFLNARKSRSARQSRSPFGKR